MTRGDAPRGRPGKDATGPEPGGNLRSEEPGARSIWLGRLLVLSLVLAAMLGTFLYFFGVLR